ncbi:MAG: DUF1461 domain-containing protein [Desulfurivibrio sp.]|nr:DUF1461 domain-containing protein [Desulfurivibrio sp.]
MIPWLLAAELLSRGDRSLGQLVADGQKAFPVSGEINRRVSDPAGALARVKAWCAEYEGVFDDTDGLGFGTADFRFNLPDLQHRAPAAPECENPGQPFIACANNGQSTEDGCKLTDYGKTGRVENRTNYYLMIDKLDRSELRRLPGWLLVGCLLPTALLLAWLTLARLDFLYAVWYQALAIEEHITYYAPQNRQGRADFAQTSPEEHRRLFGLIVQAIQGREEPLASAHYYNAEGRKLGKFLRAEEIGHLRDVKRLVAVLTRAGWWFTAAALFLAPFLWWRRLPLPLPGGVAAMWLLLLGVVGIILWWQGPQEVFDRLHQWIFPPDHPWFFYYQDSLMTTTMKAPQIFAAIAALWTLLSLGIYALLYAGARHLAGKT